jgi:hypothetical protein
LPPTIFSGNCHLAAWSNGDASGALLFMCLMVLVFLAFVELSDWIEDHSTPYSDRITASTDGI